MSKIKYENNTASFECPGCKLTHRLPVTLEVGGEGWFWDGSLDSPTLSPSILTRSGHYINNGRDDDDCWCDYNKDHPDQEVAFECGICHSYVKDGKITFLPDSTHELSGQVVELGEFRDGNI